ncbi:MAG: C4-dicarboxylate ABC transporter substrate-binding protein, partial [Candidatus Rokubacteria bacterium]|nr:C4-dicarboxylate ABC transporter substrate-binding protein [Candidatus Rokubacteria bacterium]
MARAIRTGVATLACTLLLTAAVTEAQQVTWKAALFGPPRAVTMPLDWFAKEVAAKTGGQVKIELVYGEALAK